MQDLIPSDSDDTSAWTFHNTADWFDDHICRSVPGYNLGHDIVISLADYFIQPNGVIYDIGCSTGHLTQKLAKKAQPKQARVIGLDSESSMINYAVNAHNAYDSALPITWVCDSVLTHEFEPHCDLIVAYYTVQFIPPQYRQVVINRLYHALHTGGALILFEKIQADTAQFQDIATGVYTDYKLSQGYTAHDIIKKSRQIRQVLTPYNTAMNAALIKTAGFSRYSTVFKHTLFEGVLAIK